MQNKILQNALHFCTCYDSICSSECDSNNQYCFRKAFYEATFCNNSKETQ